MTNIFARLFGRKAPAARTDASAAQPAPTHLTVAPPVGYTVYMNQTIRNSEGKVLVQAMTMPGIVAKNFGIPVAADEVLVEWPGQNYMPTKLTWLAPVAVPPRPVQRPAPRPRLDPNSDEAIIAAARARGENIRIVYRDVETGPAEDRLT